MGIFRAARAATIGLCLVGVVVFGALLAVVQSSAQNFEARAQAFIIHEVEKEVGETLASLQSPQLPALTGKLSEQMQAHQREIAAAVSDFVAAAVAAMCRLDCAQRAQLEATLADIYERQLAKLRIGIDKLRAIVEGRYKAALTELRRDIVIFLASNLLVMGMALVLALYRGAAVRHLLPIAILLTVSTLVAACWYVFGQNWLWTIIYSDYIGWSYLGVLAILFMFLVDIALNRARATSEALNVISQMLGGGPSWSPC
jgi:hypothetical protein